MMKHWRNVHPRRHEIVSALNGLVKRGALEDHSEVASRSDEGEPCGTDPRQWNDARKKLNLLFEPPFTNENPK